MRFSGFAILVILSCTLSISALAAPPLPGKADRCAVCGMLVAPFPQWVAALELTDGRVFYFDGPKDMFVAFFDLPAYLPGVGPEQIAGVYVTDYYETWLRPAGEVIFVTGSDVLGPMGQELIPVVGSEAAETFRRDHKGQKLLRLDGRQLVEIQARP
jgi:nitrous oxide reductase accessory protein NosL